MDENLTLSKSYKTDYILAACCGGLAGILDIIFVGSPEDSILGKVVDNSADSFVQRAAKFFWKSDKRENGKPKKVPDTLERAISYLEQAFPVNYDARYAKDLQVDDGVLSNMNPKNHHLLSIAHSPDIIGLIFSIIDQFSEDGSASFIDQGKIIHVVPKKTSGAIPYLQGSETKSKIFCGFINWLGHMLSDITGSSSTRKQGKEKRGMGVPMPFYNAFLGLDCELPFSEGTTLAETMIKVYENGYDLRFGVTASIPVIINELMIRAVWTIRQRFFFHKDWKECIPIGTGNIPELRIMLLLGNGAFCLVDGVDAIAHGVKGASWATGISHLNIPGWTYFTILVIKEAVILAGNTFGYTDTEHIEFIFGKLSESEKKAVEAFEALAKEMAGISGAIKMMQEALSEYAEAKEERIRIEKECSEKINQLLSCRQQMQIVVEGYLSHYLVEFGTGFSLIEEGFSDQDSDKIIAGNRVIQKSLGKEQQFEDQDEFDLLMLSDDNFKM